MVSGTKVTRPSFKRFRLANFDAKDVRRFRYHLPHGEIVPVLSSNKRFQLALVAGRFVDHAPVQHLGIGNVPGAVDGDVTCAVTIDQDLHRVHVAEIGVPTHNLFKIPHGHTRQHGGP